MDIAASQEEKFLGFNLLPKLEIKDLLLEIGSALWTLMRNKQTNKQTKTNLIGTLLQEKKSTKLLTLLKSVENKIFYG